jgi:hypothetical protein
MSLLFYFFLCPRIERSGTYSFWPVRLFVCLSAKTFNIGHIFWKVSDKAFIFHMCVSYDKTFLLVPKFLTLWPWPWSLTHFSKSLTLTISFELHMIGLSHFICVFLMTRPFYWYQHLWPWPWSLTHFPKTLTLAIYFEWWVIGLSYFICMLLVTRPLYLSRKFWNLDLEFWRWWPPLEFASYGGICVS